MEKGFRPFNTFPLSSLHAPHSLGPLFQPSFPRRFQKGESSPGNFLWFDECLMSKKMINSLFKYARSPREEEEELQCLISQEFFMFPEIKVSQVPSTKLWQAKMHAFIEFSRKILTLPFCTNFSFKLPCSKQKESILQNRIVLAATRLGNSSNSWRILFDTTSRWSVEKSWIFTLLWRWLLFHTR